MLENYELTFLLNYAVTSSDESPVFRLDVDVTGKPPYYSAALSALRRKVGADVLPVEEVNTELIDGYVCSLFSSGVSKNSVSSYLRAIRSLYNKQVKLSALPRTDAFSCATDLIDRAASARIRTARPSLPRQRSDARFWRVVRNSRFADRDAIRSLVSTVAADAEVFMPDAVLYRRNRAGKLKKTPDRLLRPLLFVRLSSAEADSLQRLMGYGATIFFTRNGNRKSYSAISNREMANFSLAVGTGLGELQEWTDHRSFVKGQRIRVVGHPLFDGLVGEIDADSPADELNVKVVLRGGGLVFVTDKIHRSQMEVIE